jgi:hypothetical protein
MGLAVNKQYVITLYELKISRNRNNFSPIFRIRGQFYLATKPTAPFAYNKIYKP